MKSLTVCTWVLTSKREKLYHDTEWGIPIHDDAILFECVVLE
ncbi:DNA-3-methyladenine glycosylase I [Veillonella montpellierensis]|nr:DNA-3-methyladenine glycosylase I [Veillonella montpellierensis]